MSVDKYIEENGFNGLRGGLFLTNSKDFGYKIFMLFQNVDNSKFRFVDFIGNTYYYDSVCNDEFIQYEPSWLNASLLLNKKKELENSQK